MSMYPDQSGLKKPWELNYATDDKAVGRFFNTVYAWMAVGLAVTASVAWFCSQNMAAVRFIHGGGIGVAIAIALGMFALAYAVQHAALRISATAATALFLLYAALMGALLSSIFLVYKLPTIGSAFVITGGTFAVMSIYGFVTKRDLTRMGSVLVMCVVGLFIASIVNLFIASNGLSWLITYAVLLVFVLLTAYETQKLKVLAQEHGNDPDLAPRIAIIGSLLLYIAFINMFLSILRILGDRR
jgi:FtsH-binding integral membrane protein